MRISSYIVALLSFVPLGCTTEPQSSTPPVGRFHLTIYGNNPREIFIIDTATGQAWDLPYDSSYSPTTRGVEKERDDFFRPKLNW